jgi:UMF1 family MFS transporter
VYPLIISSAIFPILYETQTSIKNEAGRTIYDTISFLGREFHNTEFYAYVICLSYIVVALISPLLSGIADAGGKRKLFMQFFCYLGAFSSALLYFFHADQQVAGTPFVIGWSIVPLFFGSIGFWGSLVYYNAYLPDIAEPKDHDKVSARGFSMGYLGSSTLLIIVLILTVFTKVISIQLLPSPFLGSLKPQLFKRIKKTSSAVDTKKCLAFGSKSVKTKRLRVI